MAYTVKKLSEMSGVTVRTLHFYEANELLMPAYYGANGYRYYEEKQLLQLQQILFFKELGFTLKQVRQVIGKSDFDQLAALYSHSAALKREWERIGCLLETIDKTIKHIKGKKKMKDQELFAGFHITLVQASQDKSYSAAEKIVIESVKNPTKTRKDVESLGAAYYNRAVETAHGIFEELARCIKERREPASETVQKVIKKHHEFTEKAHFASQKEYKALAKLYAEHPDFRKQLEPFHPDLAGFMSHAMILFADKKLI